MPASARVLSPLSASAAPDAALVAGSGCLRFASVAGRTVVTRASAAAPLKILNPRNVGASAWAYLATYGGGLVGGDQIRVQIDVGPQAVALVSTQASTKVYRSHRPAGQVLDAAVAADGVLVMLPDPVTCFADSRYAQEQRIRLDRGASLLLVDRLTAGRIDSGERWMFHQYASRTMIWQGDKLVLHDALSLGAADAVTRRMGCFNCVASIALLGPALETTAARLIGEAGSAPLTRDPDFLMSAAPIGDAGALLRIASRSVEDVAIALRQRLSIVTALLGDDPWSRKW
jgi:urease accessory protein